jgi:hypothetical protein
MAKISRLRVPWLLLSIAGLLVALISYVPKFSGHEVRRAPSPDGSVDAVLIEVPRDAAGAHSYKVCFYRPNDHTTTTASCNEIAYLAGVGATQPVELIWTAPRQLEIRYVNATSIQIYKAKFIWRRCWLGPCIGRYGSNLPIAIRAVQISDTAVSH